MSRYIDADALIADLEYDIAIDEDILHYVGTVGAEKTNTQFDKDCKQNAIDLLIHAPSIDIEPKRGEWKPFDLTWGRSIWYCTACEESTEVPCDIWTHKPIYKYCPNCGAKMTEREGE